MNPVETYRETVVADPADDRCPGCFGWGFPIGWFNGREAYNVSVACPDCNGRGRREVSGER